MNSQAVTTSYRHNSFGQVLTASALGKVTTNAYDKHGNLVSVTTPAPNANTPASITQFAYDTRRLLTQIIDPLNHEYDSRGNRAAVIDALQHLTEFAYYEGDRLTTITFPDQTTAEFAMSTAVAGRP